MALHTKLLVGLIGILTIYSVPCFIAHYLDFGWKLIGGTWLHKSVPFIKKMRSGLFHQLLISLLLAIFIYGGLTDFLGFIPKDWGRIDEVGQVHPYRRIISTLSAVALAGIIGYAFDALDTLFEKEERVK